MHLLQYVLREAVRTGTGKSVYYTLDNGHIYLQCTTWGKEAKKREYIFDNLRLTLLGMEFYNWFENEAY